VPPANLPYLLISDFDGTITRRDFFELATTQCLAPDTPDYWARYMSGAITHFEAMQAIYSKIRCDSDAMHRIVQSMEPDPELSPAVARLRGAGWDMEIVSAGCNWYIDILLAAAGIEVTVHANPGQFIEGRGLLMELPAGSPYCSRSTGIDKEAVVRCGMERYERVAFAGNGKPDLAAALLVDDDLRFARGWLAGALSRRGVPYHRFSWWSEIVHRLTRRNR